MTTVSFIVPALNEADHIGDCLDSIARQDPYERIVVDGGSDDRTAEIAERHGATVIHDPDGSRASGRNKGAQAATGDVYAFIDADTVLAADYLDEQLALLEDEGLIGVTSRVQMRGTFKALPMQWTINHVFPRLRRPVLPGFNTMVRRGAFDEAGGFPEVPNEDTAFSRRLAAIGGTGYHPEQLVTTSARRIERYGLTGTALYYLYLDMFRIARS